MNNKKIVVFDTTLRDGEQAPGMSMTIEEKVIIAKQLEKLGVDVIEAGFAASSESDFEAIRRIANEVKTSGVASLARALKSDIDRAYEAVKGNVRPRIHTFIATSEIHMKYKLKMSKEEVIRRAVDAVVYAKSFCDDIEFSAEDATRSDWEFLVEIFEKVIEAGATVINVPDTVGYTTPDEMADLVRYLNTNIKNMDKAIISVHCHNDLGLAVANSLAAIRAGATQVECTVNGIGERAGNAAVEEIVMGLRTRKDVHKVDVDINSKEIFKTSSMITEITGVEVQPNKAIVGRNAFLHESGIHQHGMLNNSETYEIMSPSSIGLDQDSIVLGKHSGQHAIVHNLNKLGIKCSTLELNYVIKQVKEKAEEIKLIDSIMLKEIVESYKIT